MHLLREDWIEVSLISLKDLLIRRLVSPTLEPLNLITPPFSLILALKILLLIDHSTLKMLGSEMRGALL